ncbi:unnamed protein product [Mytilus edulis]|uniref:Uncharacterized protein n=1 Tax=Mytilus edulis TaxID=6550 RepID=A0A8S3UEJ9_MYTED|nr:unnamed protein product [Mytilus edulis]
MRDATLLIDTGAVVSLVNKNMVPNIELLNVKPNYKHIVSATGQPLNITGILECEISDTNIGTFEEIDELSDKEPLPEDPYTTFSLILYSDVSDNELLIDEEEHLDNLDKGFVISQMTSNLLRTVPINLKTKKTTLFHLLSHFGDELVLTMSIHKAFCPGASVYMVIMDALKAKKFNYKSSYTKHCESERHHKQEAIFNGRAIKKNKTASMKKTKSTLKGKRDDTESEDEIEDESIIDEEYYENDENSCTDEKNDDSDVDETNLKDIEKRNDSSDTTIDENYTSSLKEDKLKGESDIKDSEDFCNQQNQRILLQGMHCRKSSKCEEQRSSIQSDDNTASALTELIKNESDLYSPVTKVHSLSKETCVQSGIPLKKSMFVFKKKKKYEGNTRS